VKKLLAFDMDGTLALSKQPLDDEMGALLARLSKVAKVAVISGGDWPQFEKQVVSRLPDDADKSSIYILPTTGTKMYHWQNGQWENVYAELFSDDEGQKIRTALKEAVEEAGFSGEQTWGPQIEDRGSQVTFSALGQEAPLGPKDAWDHDRKKREKLQQILQGKLPELSINIGGATSIDITRKGIDKAYGLKRLAEHTGLTKEDMLFLGDAIFPGGNDYPAKTMGMDTVRVRDVDETKAVLQGVIPCLA
jgi:hypothetical protein